MHSVATTAIHYAQSKEQILSCLNNLKTILLAWKDNKLTERVNELAQKLKENKFNLVVLGQFKRGKTTLIDSLLGCDLLPVAVVPLTSAVTFIRYGEHQRIEVVFTNSERKEIAQHELVDYITEKGNPENRKNVRYVEIFYPSPFLKDGVVLTDTPGIGSVYLHNTDTTYDFIPKVDAAIFIVSTDPPITQTEVEFLREVKQYVDKIFFVLNKIDYLSEAEQREALDFTASVIRKQVGNGDVTLYPISARLALEGKARNDKGLLERSRLQELEERIEEFLIKGKGQTLLSSISRSILRLIAEAEFSLQLEIKTTITPLEELETKINEFNRQFRVIQKEQEDFEYLLKGEIGKLNAYIEEQLKQFEEDEPRHLQKRLKEFARQQLQLNGREFLHAIEGYFRHCLISDFDEWRQVKEKEISRQFEQILQRFAEKTNSFIERIITLSADLFEIGVEPFAAIEGFTAKSNFYYKIEDDPVMLGVDVKKVYPLLPKGISHQLLTNAVLKKIYEKVSMNCGRVRYDFIERVEKSYAEFKRSLDQKIQTIISEIGAVLEKGIQRKKQSEQEVNEQLKKLRSALKAVRGVKEQLTMIKLTS